MAVPPSPTRTRTTYAPSRTCLAMPIRGPQPATPASWTRHSTIQLLPCRADPRVTAGARGFRSGDQLGLVSAPACTAVVERHLGLTRFEPLSQAALESRSIAANEQPVTRADIRAIRAVHSEAVVETLMAPDRRPGHGADQVFRDRGLWPRTRGSAVVVGPGVLITTPTSCGRWSWRRCLSCRHGSRYHSAESFPLLSSTQMPRWG
jgi:putative transcriptional regulator (Ypuh-like)